MTKENNKTGFYLPCHQTKETVLKVTIDTGELAKKKKKRRRLLSRDKQLIASDTRWHRSNPLNNTQCHSRYKPLIQRGDPAGAHQQFQPRSCSFQLQLMLTQIARHQSRAMQSISQHTQRSASVPFGCWLRMLGVNILGGFCLVGFYLQHQWLFALLCGT